MAIAAGLTFISVIIASIIGYPALSYISANSTFLTLMTWGSGLLVILIPFFLVLALLIRLYGPYRLKKKWSSMMVWVWVVAFIILFASSMFTIKDFSYFTEVEENNYFTSDTDQITLSLGPDNNEKDGSIFNFDIDEMIIDEDGMHCGLVRVRIYDTDEDQIRIHKNIRSNGSSRNNAKRNASNIIYDVEVEDGQITFPRTYLIPKGKKFRGQRIDLDVYIPKGKNLEVDKKLKWFNFKNRYEKQ